MNWTGGRLRRQSHNRPGSLSTIQKQYFAKARLRLRDASNRVVASHIVPFFEHNYRISGVTERNLIRPHTSPVSNEGERENELRSEQTQKVCSHGLEPSQRQLSLSQELRSSRISHESISGPPYSKLPHTESLKATQNHSRTSKLDNIKLRLLRQQDWAGISATRPLQMKFPSVEEKEKVGKRRRIIKCDETRQASVLKRPFTAELSPIRRKQGQRDKVVYTDASDNISIRINGHRENKVLGGYSQKPVPRQESTEPMLLDGDEAWFPKLTRSQRDYPEHNKPSVQTSLLELSSEDAMTMASNHSRQSVVTTQVYSDLPVDDTDTDQRTENQSPTAISTANVQRSSNGSFSPISHKSSLPVLRRFTIDDQALAERENEMTRSLSSIGQQSTYETHVHNPTSPPSPEPLSRSRSYFSESSLINSSDRIIHRTESLASYQTGSERKATHLFATPKRRLTSIQDTETCKIARTRADWNVHAGSACEDRTPPPIFFGQAMPQSLLTEVDQVQTPSLRLTRPVEQRSQSVSERSQPERSDLDMRPPHFMHEPLVPDSRNSSRQSSRHTSTNNAYDDDDDRKFSTNIHCHANQMRTSFRRNRAILSPLMHSERQPTTTITNSRAEKQAGSSSSLPSESPFRFPAYRTPQQERRHTAGRLSPAAAGSSSPRKRIPSSSSHSPFSFDRFILPETNERLHGRELQADRAVWEEVNNNASSAEPETDTIPPFFNTPFRR
ncbi:hypothetical protein VTN96DRAFT_6985 [Rasamsonia emersonii]